MKCNLHFGVLESSKESTRLMLILRQFHQVTDTSIHIVKGFKFSTKERGKQNKSLDRVDWVYRYVCECLCELMCELALAVRVETTGAGRR